MRAEGGPAQSTPASGDRGYTVLVARGAGVVFAGSVVSFGLRYLFQLVVARQVGVAMFGLFSLAVSVFGMAEVIALLGTPKGVVRFVALHHGDGDARRARGTVVLAALLALMGGILVCMSVTVFAGPLSTKVFHASDLAPILRVLAVAVPFSALTMVFVSATLGLRIMKYKVYVRDGLEQVVRIAVVTVLFLFGLRLWAAVWAFVAAVLAGTIASYVLYRRVFRSMAGSTGAPVLETRRLVTYCWPLLFADWFVILDVWLTTLMVGFLLAPVSVGVFSAGHRTSLLVQGILLSFNTVFAPIISGLHHKGEISELERLFKLVSKWIFSLSIPPVLVMIMLPREVMSIFGPDFVVGASVLLILGAGELVSSSAGPLSVMIDMSGRSKVTLLNAVPHFVLQSALCLFLIPRYGVVGAALARAVSLGLLRLAQLIEVRCFLHMHPFRRDFAKPLAAGAVATVVLTLAKGSLIELRHPVLVVLAGAAVLTAVYGLVLRALGISEDDREIMRAIRAKLRK
jgi:O-antigen/teichoic acid export membrane protein